MERLMRIVRNTRIEVSPTIVVNYIDEDGEGETSFPNQKEATKWIKYQESLRHIGEKFEVISINKR